MTWENILKNRRDLSRDDMNRYWAKPDEWYRDMEEVIGIGEIFEDFFHLGQAGGETVWYYLENPHKWNPEYKILYDAGMKLKLDPEALLNYMYDNDIYSIENLKKHIEEKNKE